MRNISNSSTQQWINSYTPSTKSWIGAEFCSDQSAKVSDHPSPIPPASVVWRHRPVPPPVSRLDVPCVASWKTISDSRAPSLSGYKIEREGMNNLSKNYAYCRLEKEWSERSCSPNDRMLLTKFHRNILMRPDWPLYMLRMAKSASNQGR